MTPDLLAQLAAVEQAHAAAPPEEIPGLLAELERLRAQLWRRMMMGTRPAGNDQPGPPAEGDRLLTPEEAASMLGLTVEQLKRRRNIPRKSLGRRTVRYSRRALDRWLTQRSS